MGERLSGPRVVYVAMEMYRYYGHPDNPSWKHIKSLGQSVLIRIIAEKIFHWDFSPK